MNFEGFIEFVSVGVGLFLVTASLVTKEPRGKNAFVFTTIVCVITMFVASLMWMNKAVHTLNALQNNPNYQMSQLERSTSFQGESLLLCQWPLCIGAVCGLFLSTAWMVIKARQSNPRIPSQAAKFRAPYDAETNPGDVACSILSRDTAPHGTRTKSEEVRGVKPL